MRRTTNFPTPALALGAALLLYLAIIGPFSTYMTSKPIDLKLGYVPNTQIIRPLSAGMKELAGAGLVMKVMMYFGGQFEQSERLVQHPPDYAGMSRLLNGAVALDPYNMDAYYFAQAFLVWDAGQVEAANAMLDHGMKHRHWDWYLAFFAGFNHAYFLNDYEKAAVYYKRAADLTGESLFINLAGRYMHESGQTRLAIGYLRGMLATGRDDLAKHAYAVRLEAFEAVLQIEMARDRFVEAVGSLPEEPEELVRHGLLTELPDDPYGGRFYLLPDGKVVSTSNFAFGAGPRKDN